MPKSYVSSIHSLITVAMFFVSSLFITSVLSAQILTNPDFESKEEPKDRETDWVIGKEKLPITLGEGAGGEGNSLLLRSNSSNSNGLYFSQQAPLRPDSLCQYELSFKVKTKGLKKGSTGFVWINLLDADRAMVLETGWGRYKGTKDWTSYSYTFLVPSNTKAIKVGGTISGKGTLWFDDFELKEVDFRSEEVKLSANADQYIRAAVDTMRRRAVNRHKLDFDDIYQIIRYNAQGADKSEDTHQAIKLGVRYLIDNRHSNLFTPDEMKELLGDVNLQDMLGDANLQKPGMNLDSLKATIGFSTGKPINDQIGYLSIPQFTNAYLAGVIMFADSIQRLIRQLDQCELKGWVVDLRNNGGGATPPMVLGIGPLLQKDNKAYYASAAHEPESAFYYRNGSYYEHSVGEEAIRPTLESTISYEVKNNALPIAVLIGRGTSSAGEGVATILAGESNVRMFGDKTAGYTTANEFIVLPDDAVLNLSTTYLANQAMEVYEKGILPDEIIKANDGQNSSKDLVLEKALEWLNNN